MGMTRKHSKMRKATPGIEDTKVKLGRKGTILASMTPDPEPGERRLDGKPRELLMTSLLKHE